MTDREVIKYFVGREERGRRRKTVLLILFMAHINHKASAERAFERKARRQSLQNTWLIFAEQLRVGKARKLPSN